MKIWLCLGFSGFLLPFSTLSIAQGQNLDLADQLNGIFSSSAEAVMPAVVLIKTWENGLNPQIPITSTASGCIIDPRGYIVTSNHVAAGKTRVEISLPDGRRFLPQKIMLDPPSELAVIKIDPGSEKLPVVILGDSDLVRVGNWVLAIGSPFNLTNTVTSGIISQKGRQTNILGEDGFEDFLQTDAPINRGSSGGPLVNLHGEVIGINSNIYSPGNLEISGYGFAVPSNLVKNVTRQLIENGQVRRGYLGADLSRFRLSQLRQMTAGELTAPMDRTWLLLAQSLPAEMEGVIIVKVQPGSPAQKAGLAPKDIILEADGRKFRSSQDLRNYIAGLNPGDALKLSLSHQGRPEEKRVILGSREPFRIMPPPRISAPKPEKQTPSEAKKDVSPLASYPGIQVSRLESTLAREYGLPAETTGILIVRVFPGSPAGKSELKEGDVLTSFNQAPLESVAQFSDLLRQAREQKIGIVFEGVNSQGSFKKTLAPAVP